METPVRCECGKLKGIVKILMASNYKPVMNWKLEGFFYFFNLQRDKLPFCPECKTPVLGNEWKP